MKPLNLFPKGLCVYFGKKIIEIKKSEMSCLFWEMLEAVNFKTKYPMLTIIKVILFCNVSSMSIVIYVW
jgi:hypothetical protein